MYAAHHVNEPLLRLLLTSGASPTSHTDGMSYSPHTVLTSFVTFTHLFAALAPSYRVIYIRVVHFIALIAMYAALQHCLTVVGTMHT